MKIFDLNNEFAVSARIQHLKNKKKLFGFKDVQKDIEDKVRIQIRTKLERKELFNKQTLNTEKKHAFNLGLVSTSLYSAEISDVNDNDKGKFIFSDTYKGLSDLFIGINKKRLEKGKDEYRFPEGSIFIKETTNKSPYATSKTYIGDFLRPLNTGETKTVLMAPDRNVTFSIRDLTTKPLIINKRDIFNFK